MIQLIDTIGGKGVAQLHNSYLPITNYNIYKKINLFSDTFNDQLWYDTDQLEQFVSYWEAIGYYSFQQLMS